MEDRIRNSAENPDIGIRRSGGSDNDPDGGHVHIDNEWHTPDADPADERVSAETGDLPAGRKAANSGLPYVGTQRPNLPDDRNAEAYTSFEQPVESAENKLRINQQSKLPEVVPPDVSGDAQRP
jgi:hypothetical protein